MGVSAVHVGKTYRKRRRCSSTAGICHRFRQAAVDCNVDNLATAGASHLLECVQHMQPLPDPHHRIPDLLREASQLRSQGGQADLREQYFAHLQCVLQTAHNGVAMHHLRVDPIPEITSSPALERRREDARLTVEQLTQLRLLATMFAFAQEQSLFIMCGMHDFNAVMGAICAAVGIAWANLRRRSTMHTALQYLFLRHVSPYMLPHFSRASMDDLLLLVPEFAGKPAEELEELAKFADCVARFAAFLPLHENKLIHIEVASWLATNVQKRYVPGGGQTPDTADRVLIYERLDKEMTTDQPTIFSLENVILEPISPDANVDRLESLMDDDFWDAFVA